jgi:beta-glucanase (GH16 family)
MSDEFTAMPAIGYGTAAKWNAGLWYEAVPAPSCFSWSAAAGLTITAPSSGGNVNLTTESHDTTAAASAMYGYFEAMIAGTNWPAFWLFSLLHSRGAAGLCSELDIFEGNSTLAPDTFYGTLHSNTGGGGGVPDTFNMGAGVGALNPINTPTQLIGGPYNKFGALWTPTGATWFLNDVQLATAPAFASSAQQMFLILSAQPGGISKGPVTQPVWTACKYIRSWGPAP